VKIARLLAALPALLLACTPAPTVEAPPAPTAPPAERPPETAARPVVDELHGTKITDDYRWLEKADDPEVKAWSKAQAAWARKHLDALPGRDALRARLTQLLGAASADRSSLVARGGRLFALEEKPPLQQPFLVSLASADDAAGEQVILDPNKLDPSGKTAIDWFVPSLDGRLLAVSLSERGSENGTLHIYDARTGKEQGDTIAHVNGGTAGGSLSWNADGTGVYYTRYPRPGERPAPDLDFFQQVYFHKLGTPEKDDRYEVGKDFPRIAEVELATSDDGRHVVALVQKGDGGEFELFLRGKTWEKVASYADGVKAVRFGRDGSLYLHSVAGAPRGKLLKLAPGVADLKKARLVVPEGESVIELFEATKSRLYVAGVAGGPSDLRVFDLEGKKGAEVPILPVSAVRQLVAAGGDELLLRNLSFIDPPAWYRTKAGEKPTRTALFQTSPADYGDAEVVRDFAVSKDGTKIPLNILRKKGTKLDGQNPLILTGYGGFGVSRVPRFNPVTRLVLDHGGVYVTTNLRGGGEYGESWHQAGMLTKKQNVFDDFAAAAKRVVEVGYTKPERLAMIGGSNGGLLMGASLTQHPELSRAVVSYVGIYDMLRVELTPNGAFNVTEYGTVKDKAPFDALFAYSPYHHVQQGAAYPAVLFLTGENDPRVDPFHSRKMTARLQAATGSGRPVLLRTDADTGHGIGTPLAAEIEENVDVYGFLFQELGAK
jgi:prolyl oligopeptidase